MSPLDRHHLLFERNDYQKNRFLNTLRCMPGLIIPVPILEVHRPLHRVFDAVPTPTREAAELFVKRVATPYQKGQPLYQTLDEAIYWFDRTGNFGTADHLAAQKEFIVDHLRAEEAA